MGMTMAKKLSAATYLILFALAGILSGCSKAPVNSESALAEFIVGSYAQDNQPGIYRIQLDLDSGLLSSVSTLANSVNPSYLALTTDKQTVFAVNETNQGGVRVFNWQADGAALSLAAQISDLGDNPCHISISPDGTVLAIANYSSGDIRLFKIDNDSQATSKLRQFASHQHQGQGTHARQEAPHKHWVNWSPDGRFIYAVDLALDEVSVYKLDGETLLPLKAAIKLQAEDGPRHMLFSDKQGMAYLINELSNTVVVMQADSQTGELTEVQRLSSLPEDFQGKSQAAAIKLSPQQDFLYVSNRGRNSIAVFAVVAKGKLEYRQDISTGGDWPRDFVVSDDGEYLLVANQQSNDISVLKRDNKTGLLSATGHKIAVSQPTYLSQL